MAETAQPQTLWTIVRATGYALSSGAALAAGYLILADPWSSADIPLLFALWFSSLTFFLFYAIRFHPPDPEVVTKSLREDAERSSRVLLPVGSAIIAALCIFVYHYLTDRLPSLHYWFALFSSYALFTGYGFYLYLRFSKGSEAQIRHRLVWPAILSITVPLYSPFVFTVISEPFSALLPPLSLLLYFFATLPLSKNLFALTGLTASVLLIVATAPSTPVLDPYLPRLAVSLGIAAYLAVFEAWSVTAQTHIESQSSSPDVSRRTAYRYYLATGLALCIAALSLPLHFLFSSYGRIFLLWGATVHPAVSFLTWFSAGSSATRLANRRWLVLKTIFGALFLLIIVLDSVFRFYPRQEFLEPGLELTIWVALLTPLIAAIVKNKREWRAATREQYYARLLRNRDGFIILSLGLCYVFAFVAFLFGLRRWALTDVLTQIKADRAFLIYVLFLLLLSCGTILKEIRAVRTVFRRYNPFSGDTDGTDPDDELVVRLSRQFIRDH